MRQARGEIPRSAYPSFHPSGNPVSAVESKVATRASQSYRTPPSAVGFAFLLAGLSLLFLFVAFVYGHGWADVLTAVVGLGLLVLWIAFFSFMVWWWSRGWSRPQ